MALPRVFAAVRGCPGRCEHRPLQGVRRGGGMWFPGCPPARPSAVGADSISARVTLRRRGVARDDASIVPYRGCNNAGFEISRVAANPPLDVGEGFIPPAGVRTAAGPGGMRASRPTAARVVAANPFGRTVCHGSQGVCGGAGSPGPMRASAPTRRAAWRGNVVSRLPTGPALGRRGGFHIRPRDPAPPRGCPGRCKHRPLQRLQQCGVRDFTGGCKPAVGCRGGFHIRPGDLAAAWILRGGRRVFPNL